MNERTKIAAVEANYEGDWKSIQAAGADGTNNTGCYHTPQIPYNNVFLDFSQNKHLKLSRQHLKSVVSFIEKMFFTTVN